MKKRIGIICGGFSSEFDISVKSARNIQANLPEAVDSDLIILSKSGWSVLQNEQEISFDPLKFAYSHNGKFVKIDAAIVYIHGDPGENGKVQALLEIIDVPYINSGPLASELSFDKWFCNQFLKGFEIPVARSIYLQNQKQLPASEEVVEQLGLPVFVKPCDSGSSYGIAKVSKTENIAPAVADAFKEGKSIVIEEFLSGTEVTCAVYRNNDGLVALPITEIVSKNEFFDYAAKYQGLSEEITPARISDEATQKVHQMAKKIYAILQLRSIARIDFMLVGDIPYVIEVNTTPGFTNESIVPKMIMASGKTTRDVWQEILAAEYAQ